VTSDPGTETNQVRAGVLHRVQHDRDRGADPDSGADREPDADPESVARSICLNQLDRAPRTRAQLAVTLQRRLVPEDVADRVLDRLEAVGLVDDEAFASAWVQSRHGTRGLSGRALGRELRTRGVEAETVEAAVAQLDADTELDTAYRLVRARQRSMSSLDPAVQQRRLVALLGRKGYAAGVAYRVVREVVRDGRPDTTVGHGHGP